MQRSHRRSSSPISRSAGENDQGLPVLLELLSPSAAIVATPIPRAGRSVVWMIGSLFAASVAALGLVPVDRVVTAPGMVISTAARIVVQPLETAIVRSIEVREGKRVRAGDVLARLDPTFAAADAGALQAQVSSLQAAVSRMRAELEEQPFRYSGIDPSMSLQAAIYAQREAERRFRLEYFRQKIDGLRSAVARAAADARLFHEREAVAQNIEAMRRKLEKLQVGSRLNLLAATDTRLEVERSLASAVETGKAATADLAAMIAERNAYVQNWHAEIAQTLSEESRKLSDAREALKKALLRRKLVELRADRDATVLTVAKVSEGSVLQPGEQLMTLVPSDAPLEIEASISGHDNGFVHLGDPVAIKFATFPFSQYGMALGHLRVISPDSFTAAEQRAADAKGAAPASKDRSEPAYSCRITIDRVALHGVPADFRIVPGMPVTADIKVGKRTVLGYLLGRVLDAAAEGMREP